jgi:hypothetical protein
VSVKARTAGTADPAISSALAAAVNSTDVPIASTPGTEAGSDGWASGNVPPFVGKLQEARNKESITGKNRIFVRTTFSSPFAIAPIHL